MLYEEELAAAMKTWFIRMDPDVRFREPAEKTKNNTGFRCRRF